MTSMRPLVVLCAGLFALGCDQRVNSRSDSSPLTVPVALRVEPAEVMRHDPRCWPGFRGGIADGVSRGSNLPERLAAATADWSVRVPGDGNSSPVIWRQHVFVTAHVTDRGRSELAVFCFDRGSGRRLWRREVGVPTGASHPKNGHASATVCTDGQYVVASFGPMGLVGLDYNGNVLWTVEPEGAAHQWGTASSPILFDSRVILQSDGVEGSTLASYDVATGELAWSRPRDSYGSWSTPVVMFCDEAQRFELLVNGTGTANGAAGRLIAYDPFDGRPLWSVLGTTDIPCSSAIVGEGMVVSTSGSNGPIIAIRPGGSGDETATRVLWQLAHGGPQVPTGVIHDGHLYLITDGGVMTCHKLDTGEERWSVRLRRRFSASLVMGDGKIYATSEDGKVHVVEAADTYRLLAVSDLGERCLATPAIVDGQLLIRTARHLHAFGGGAALARSEPGDAPDSEESVDAR